MAGSNVARRGTVSKRDFVSKEDFVAACVRALSKTKLKFPAAEFVAAAERLFYLLANPHIETPFMKQVRRWEAAGLL